jgi:N-acetylneuraminic acid mutarotase
MRKLLLVVSLICIGYMANSQNFWTQKADFGGTDRYRAQGLAIGSKGYLLTGASNGVPATTDFWEYNPASNAWSQKASFPDTAKGGAAMAAFEIDGKGYFGLGAFWDGSPDGYISSSTFYMYDPSTNTWTAKATFPGGSRHGVVSFVIEGKGYVACGYNEDGAFFNDLWEYNPLTDSWTQKASIGSIQRTWSVGFSIGNKGYLGLGQSQGGTRLSDFWEYDPTSNTWTQKADYPGLGKIMGNAFAIGGYGYVGFGLNGSTPSSDFWMYNPNTNSWLAKSDLSGAARYFAGSFVVDGKAYVATGYETFYLGDLWEYTPDGYGINPENNIDASFNWMNDINELRISSQGISRVYVCDITGKVIYTQEFNGVNTAECSLPEISKGMYVFTVIGEGTSVSKKFIKY